MKLNSTRAADAALSFLTGANMEYVTHNQQEIDTQNLTMRTTVNATEEELNSLFGKGMLNKPMWRVMFKDESVAFIYPTSANVWYVESRNSAGLNNVQIALSLHREKQESSEDKDELESALEPAKDMLDTLRATKGQGYAYVVETAMMMRRMQELTHAMIGAAVHGGEIPEFAADMISKAHASMMAKAIGISARQAGLNTQSSKADADELMDWADRILKTESEGVKGLVGRLMKGDDE
jgi:hypothetical protein